MAYTVKLKTICESFNTNESTTTEQIIANSLPHIFDFNFEIFNESYRTQLETNIIRHYYFREIAFETYGQWKLKLQDRINLIMPYYNQLFQIDLDAAGVNLFENTNVTRQHLRNTDTDSEGSNTNTNTNWNVYSDTPQGSLTDVDNNTYLTNARKVTDNSSGSQTGSVSENENYIETVKGKDGGITYGEAIDKAHKAIHRTEEQFINEFEDLFFLLWQ